MKDQASTLRLISPNKKATGVLDARAGAENQTKQIRNIPCLAITGGKGGTGKSSLAVNLALELGAQGSRTLLFDADFGLANADLLCGLTPEFHLGHVIAGLKDPNEISVRLSEKVSLIPGGSGIEELANLSLEKHSHLISQFEAIENELDFMLIDTASGIAQNVLSVVVSASEVLIVATPEPTSIVDAYAMIKIILRHSPTKPISVVVNKAVAAGDAEHVYRQLNAATKNFLDRKIDFLGMIPHDPEVSEAICRQIPVTLHAPESPASRAIRSLARQMHRQAAKKAAPPRQPFWTALAGDWNN